MNSEPKYIKLNVAFREERLAELDKGKAPLVYLCLLLNQDEGSHSAPGYEAMMAQTGIRSASTIAAALRHLEGARLIQRAGIHPLTGHDCYLLPGDWSRFGPGLPAGEGLTPTIGVEDPPTTEVGVATTEVGVATPKLGDIEDDVVVERNPDSPGESERFQQQQIQRLQNLESGLQNLESRPQNLESASENSELTVAALEYAGVERSVAERLASDPWVTFDAALAWGIYANALSGNGHGAIRNPAGFTVAKLKAHQAPPPVEDLGRWRMRVEDYAWQSEARP